jgi:AraC-like DNA-binding protein
MLFAGGERTLGAARLLWRMVFGGRFWWFFVHRRGLVHDTRWVPGTRGPERDNTCIYLLLGGTFEVFGSAPRAVEAPLALVLTEEQLEGAHDRRSFVYRAAGEPFVALQIHFPDSLLGAACREASAPTPRILALDDEAWSAARAVAEAALSSADESLEPMQRLLRSLVRHRAVRAEALSSAAAKTPASLELLWKGVRPIVERLYLTPTVEEVSGATGISVRQVDRYVAQFLERFGHVGGTGWRLATRHVRLKLAVLWLSAEGVSVADVATATSYGSTDAMARAFRDANLPAPSVVQAELRHAHVRPVK